LALRKDYAFVQVLAGTIFLFVPILVILTMSSAEEYTREILLSFNIFGIVSGFLAAALITNGYYKLTERFKESSL